MRFQSSSTVLLSHSIARSLFGNEDPHRQNHHYRCRPEPTGCWCIWRFSCQQQFQEVAFIAPFRDLTSWVKGNEDNWYNKSFQVFVQIADHADFKNVSARIKDIKQHVHRSTNCKNRKTWNAAAPYEQVAFVCKLLKMGSTQEALFNMSGCLPSSVCLYCCWLVSISWTWAQPEARNVQKKLAYAKQLAPCVLNW